MMNKGLALYKESVKAVVKFDSNTELGDSLCMLARRCKAVR